MVPLLAQSRDAVIDASAELLDRAAFEQLPLEEMDGWACVVAREWPRSPPVPARTSGMPGAVALTVTVRLLATLVFGWPVGEDPLGA